LIPPRDTSTVVVDTGTVVVDTSTVVVDTNTSTVDGTTATVDTSTVPTNIPEPTSPVQPPLPETGPILIMPPFDIPQEIVIVEEIVPEEQPPMETIEDILEQNLPALLGFTPEMKLMKGINVLSLGWPIEGNADKGIVQLDIIPLSNMDWAKFIFYSPDYRYNESRYKSAHRNWLIQAILSALKEIESTDENGNIQDFYSYALRLSDGIYKNKKTFKGVTKRLKNPETVKGSTEFITREPQEVIGMVFGPGIKENDIRTFEKAWKVVTSPSYIYSDKVEEIICFKSKVIILPCEGNGNMSFMFPERTNCDFTGRKRKRSLTQRGVVSC
jgi:hypothetical protein